MSRGPARRAWLLPLAVFLAALVPRWAYVHQSARDIGLDSDRLTQLAPVFLKNKYMLGDNFSMLDVAIGLVLLYLLLSLVCSALLEGFQNFFNRRGLVLETQLLRLMGWRTLREFCSQPGFASLSARASRQPTTLPVASASDVEPKSTVVARWRHFSRFPAYIPSDVFAELAVSWHERFHQSREWCDDHEFGRVMLRLGNECGTDRARLQAKVAEWFDKTMQRASGRFKARTNLWFALIAALLVIAANADPLRLATEMYRNPAIQQVLVTQADVLTGAQSTTADTGQDGASEQAQGTGIKIASEDLRKAIAARMRIIRGFSLLSASSEL